MNDWAWIDADDDLEASVGAQTNGTEFRRARLYVAGEGGYGAWELAARFSSLDLRVRERIDGGELRNVTAGVNWYLHPNARVMLNYVHSRVDERGLSGSVDADMVQTRFQIDF